MLDSIEYIPVEENGPIKAREQSWLTGGENEESEDENFDWITELEPSDRDEKTYFTFINESRMVMKKGS